MILLIDMDGPVADFNGLFFERCGDLGIEFDCTIEDQRHKFATAHIIDKNLRSQARAMCHEPGWFFDLAPVEGAIEGLRRLHERDDTEVWICTKPLEANPACRDDKARWVVKYLGEEWARRLIIAPDKSLVVGDILLDDGPALEWFERATWNPVIFPAPFNGIDSQWGGLDAWTWTDPIDNLLSLGGDILDDLRFG